VNSNNNTRFNYTSVMSLIKSRDRIDILHFGHFRIEDENSSTQELKIFKYF